MTAQDVHRVSTGCPGGPTLGTRVVPTFFCGGDVFGGDNLNRLAPHIGLSLRFLPQEGGNLKS